MNRTEGVDLYKLCITTLATLLISTGVALTGIRPAHATNELSVQILSPAENSTVGTGTVNVTGRIGSAGSTTSVVYVVDVSGSTDATAGDCNGDSAVDGLDDLNGDGINGTVLDCEISGVVSLNTSLAPRSDVQVGLVAFGSSAASADMSSADGSQAFIQPGEDGADGGDVENVADAVNVATSLRGGAVDLFEHNFVGSSTNFDAALAATQELLKDVSGPKVVFFLSDGQASVSADPSSPLAVLKNSGVLVRTFAVGTGTGAAPCDPGEPLATIANETNGTCRAVTDPTQLRGELASPLPGLSVELELFAVPALPRRTTATVNALGEFSASFDNVASNQWTVTVSAATADGKTGVASRTFRAAPAHFTYVSIGDSYSSGEGLDPFLSDAESQACHRSPDAYSKHLTLPGQSIPLSNDPSFRFAACAGAVITNVLAHKQNTGPDRNSRDVPLQVDRLSADANLVTISIGGNDASFVKILQFCYANDGTQGRGSSCFDSPVPFATLNSASGLSLRQWVSLRLAVFTAQLPAVYSAIKERAPAARVLVVGYPPLMGLQTGFACIEGRYFNLAERRDLDAAARQFDAGIAAAVTRAGVEYVSVYEQWKSHVVCSGGGEKWLNGADLAAKGTWPFIKADDQAFHPTRAGQLAYASQIREFIRDNQPATLNLSTADAIDAPSVQMARATKIQSETTTFTAEAQGSVEILPDWVRALYPDLPQVTDSRAFAASSAELDALSVASPRAAAGKEDGCLGRPVPGQAQRIYGTGWRPGSDVAVAVGRISAATVKADSNGVIDALISIPTSAGDGGRSAVVIAATGFGASGADRILSTMYELEATTSRCATAARAAGELAPVSTGHVLLVLERAQKFGSLKTTNQDVLSFDPGTKRFSMLFDGSDVGLKSAIDAVAQTPDGDLLLSLTEPGRLFGVGSFDDSDIVRFHPDQLGSTTRGRFSFYFDGSDVGLTTPGEDIGSVAFKDGDLYFTVKGPFSIKGGRLTGGDRDVVVCRSPQTGRNSGCRTVAIAFHGRKAGLEGGGEGIDAFGFSPTGAVFSTQTSFSVPGAVGGDHDVFACTGTLAACEKNAHYTLFLDGDVFGLSSNDIKAIYLPPASGTGS